MSIEYYDRNAARFFQDTVAADADHVRQRFLRHVPDGGVLLDAGCGSGRDSKAFLRQGYAVTAFDAAGELAQLATDHLGQPVLHLRFDEVEWRDHFDGVWASASLLHVSEAELPGVMRRLVASLKPAGILFASFKYGAGERLHRERLFTDMDEARMGAALAAAGLDVLELWTTQDVRPNRGAETWMNGLGRRVP